MTLPNIFTKDVTNNVISRIEKLSPDSEGKWGKMDVAQMLAHCNVSYEMVYENKHPKPNAFMKLILKLLVKGKVVNATPYKPGGPTAPAFIIKDQKDFHAEKIRLIDFISKTQQLGESYFDGKKSHSFGSLTKEEWNNMFYKHLDHHLKQFDV